MCCRYGSPIWTSPPAVIDALQRRVAHGVYGYGEVPATLTAALCQWSAHHYAWTIEPEWQQWLPGVVPALHFAAMALTQPGEGVLTIAPIYPPFLAVAERTGRLAQQAMLAEPAAPGEPWQLDIAALEAAITPQTRLLLWCHPHNPTGRVWMLSELEQLAALVERHDLWVVSDELHCDCCWMKEHAIAPWRRCSLSLPNARLLYGRPQNIQRGRVNQRRGHSRRHATKALCRGHKRFFTGW